MRSYVHIRAHLRTQANVARTHIHTVACAHTQANYTHAYANTRTALTDAVAADSSSFSRGHE